MAWSADADATMMSFRNWLLVSRVLKAFVLSAYASACWLIIHSSPSSSKELTLGRFARRHQDDVEVRDTGRRSLVYHLL